MESYGSYNLFRCLFNVILKWNKGEHADIKKEIYLLRIEFTSAYKMQDSVMKYK